jgi:hypothetical protein
MKAFNEFRQKSYIFVPVVFIFFTKYSVCTKSVKKQIQQLIEIGLIQLIAMLILSSVSKLKLSNCRSFSFQFLPHSSLIFREK